MAENQEILGFKCQICFVDFSAMDILTKHFSSDHKESKISYLKLVASSGTLCWIEHIQDEQSTKGGFYSEGTGTFIISSNRQTLLFS